MPPTVLSGGPAPSHTHKLPGAMSGPIQLRWTLYLRRTHCPSPVCSSPWPHVCLCPSLFSTPPFLSAPPSCPSLTPSCSFLYEFQAHLPLRLLGLLDSGHFCRTFPRIPPKDTPPGEELGPASGQHLFFEPHRSCHHSPRQPLTFNHQATLQSWGRI